MLATSSSDEDDYDLKKKPQQPVKSSPGAGGGGFKQSQGFQQQPGSAGVSKQPHLSSNPSRGNQLNVTGATQAISNMHLTNGDTLSTRSSFSNSTSNEFLNNRNSGIGGNTGPRMNSNNNSSSGVFNSNRNASFKSNSSSSTMSGVTLMGNQNSTPRPIRANQAMTPKSGRQLPRRPGAMGSDSMSYTSRGLTGNDDSDDSDYNVSHYPPPMNANSSYNNYSGGGGVVGSGGSMGGRVIGDSDEEEDSAIATGGQDFDQSMTTNGGGGGADDNESSMSFSGTYRSHRGHKGHRDSREVEAEAAAAQAAAQLQAQQSEALKELEEHRKRLQLYVLVCRCIAYPFIAKQPTDMTRRQPKITKQQLQQIKDNFEMFLQNKMSNLEADEAFTNAVRSYYEVFLKSDRIAKMVQSGGCSSTDFRDVFKNNIEKRVRSLPEIDGLSKETVLTSWMAKFDTIYRYNEEHGTNTNVIASRRHSRNLNMLNNALSSDCILTKEQLYEMFQNILGIKKFEHQLIFNAAQLDNVDEQAATIRRELDSRMKQTENIQKQNGLMPKFVHKNMESTYIEELKQSISLLMNHLDNQPVGASESKLRLPKRPQSKPDHHQNHDQDQPCLSKSDVVLNFGIEVVVMEVKGLKSLPPNRIVFCVMEVEGHSKLQTDQAEASRPIWDTSGDFKTQQSLPVIKVKLCMETQNILHDNKEIGRVVIRPDPNFTRASTWYVMDKSNSKFPDELKIKLTIRIDKPGNLKMCGWCFCMGKNLWKKWKRRYLCLVQVSAYTFALCSYMEKKSEPRELMTLDNFTVDYSDVDTELKAQGGKHFFNAVREGDTVTLATDEEQERQLWIQALYRATGQSHKPTPPTAIAKSTASQLVSSGDGDKVKKNQMEEFIQTDPSVLNHNDFFKLLQSSTLEYRLNDPFCSLGWFSPGQIFVLDEYQARYGVRGCYRHLCYLSDLLDRAEQNSVVDPTLLHYSFAFCACHVHGNRPDGIGTVTNEEKVKFDEIKERLRNLLEYQITHFRYCFPFGRPEGALKQTLSLLERVLMKDIVTPVSPEEVKTVIRKCLENAALVNYTRISQVAKVEESLYNADTNPKKKIEDLIHLAELCIDLLQQNEEHHTESFAWFCELLIEHEEIFWSLFAVDMNHVIEQQAPDSWDSFPLFQLLNDYLRNHPSLNDGRFHKHIQDTFAPLVVRYVDLMESSIGQSIHKGFEKENWRNRGQGCATSEDMLWKLDALQSFIKDLHWPDEVFAEHLESRLKEMASDMIEACSTRVSKHFDNWMKKGIILLTTGTDYVFPQECCVMVNVIIDCKAQALKLCSLNSGDLHRYHSKVDEHLERTLTDMKKQLVAKLISVLDGLLKKLARYDEGTFFSSILSLTKPVNELGQSYVNFIALNLEVLRQKVTDELFILAVFEQWYTEQINMVSAWLSERLEISLHAYQLACLTIIVKKIRKDFEMQGVPEKTLETKIYSSILSRLNVEEANQALR